MHRSVVNYHSIYYLQTSNTREIIIDIAINLLKCYSANHGYCNKNDFDVIWFATGLISFLQLKSVNCDLIAKFYFTSPWETKYTKYPVIVFKKNS